MRTIRVNEEASNHTVLWVLAGTALGVVAGILVAERASGRKLTARGFLERARRLLTRTMARGEELVDAATQLREAWGLSEEPEDEREEERDEEDEGEEYEAEEEGEADEDEEGEEGEGLDERVLVAFTNDPILADRAVEIESEEDTIILHGRVHSAREVQHAVTIARGVPGVVEVRQRLRVRPHR